MPPAEPEANENVRSALSTSSPQAGKGSEEVSRQSTDSALREIQRQFNEVRKEWKRLVEEISELRQDSKEDFDDFFDSFLQRITSRTKTFTSPPPSCKTEAQTASETTREKGVQELAETKENVEVKIDQLISLVNNHLVAKEIENSKPSLGEDMVLLIAKEVVSRLKDTVPVGFQTASSSDDGFEQAEEPSKEPPAPISLDDISAMIDQITGQGL